MESEWEGGKLGLEKIMNTILDVLGFANYCPNEACRNRRFDPRKTKSIIFLIHNHNWYKVYVQHHQLEPPSPFVSPKKIKLKPTNSKPHLRTRQPSET